jgi:hypothetical protein
MLSHEVETYSSPCLATNEYVVSQKSEQERYVGFDTANAEFNKSSQHFSSRNLVGCAADAAFHKQAIVMGCNLGSSKT